MLLGNKILTVCIGNICRSPAAEELFRAALSKRIENAEVNSAGLEALVGKPADPFAQKVMLETYGLDISSHRAQQIHDGLLKHHDLVLVMDDSQAMFLKKRYPFASGKVHRIGKWRNMNIGDPYRQSEAVFENRISLIAQCVTTWVEKFW